MASRHSTVLHHREECIILCVIAWSETVSVVKRWLKRLLLLLLLVMSVVVTRLRYSYCALVPLGHTHSLSLVVWPWFMPERFCEIVRINPIKCDEKLVLQLVPIITCTLSSIASVLNTVVIVTHGSSCSFLYMHSRRPVSCSQWTWSQSGQCRGGVVRDDRRGMDSKRDQVFDVLSVQ